MGEKEKEIY